ncbi:MAG TPA: hypothetical protein VHT68_22985, partial [Pseudolabrys sp.]|nr:hypothetical protein [Pseudolabrys sp.]
MRTIFQLAVLGFLATPAGAESLEVLGYAGVLGEWELTASVTGNDNARAYSGPLTMTHVGICTVDGPEEKKGEIRFRLSESSSRIQATLLVDGTECSYSARLSDFFTGTMNCPN